VNRDKETMAQLICEHVTLGYDGRAVISDLSFSVRAGDYLCIVGENGSGKTTLMKTILQLQAPLSGTIQTGDGLNRHAIGYLPQQSQQQRDFPASVREIVLSGCLNSSGLSPFYSKAQKERAHRNMVRLGIDGLARQRLPRAKRRAAAARAAGARAVRGQPYAAAG
jgi:zinc transport system ATP-binding protein